ncbi:MAG: geranylgeranylglyceryl/heptaprenylglyceryl phosphate synthase [Bacteroidales bacterium]|nr:geranylgeranylglyceryl/heptaprenylglyceryl phosphate synthase [Bacteroidales bacterium]
MNIYSTIYKASQSGRKQFAVLIDPDKPSTDQLLDIINQANQSEVDYFFVGGSLITRDRLDQTLNTIKANSDIPAILFPGSTLQISSKADAILFLSLISGRNPEMLIGNHVVAAPYIYEAGLEAISTGYILVESGSTTTALYMSNSMPVPRSKPEIAMCTAMAGDMLGMKLIYMDGGSGADQPVPEQMIKAVKQHISAPLIVGGGIRTPEQAEKACNAGADIIVVGNATEKDVDIIRQFSKVIHSIS